MGVPPRRPALRPSRLSSGARHSLFLLGTDTVTNAIDYAFHFYLALALAPAAFSIVQTINAAVLILSTAFGVMQPVVARTVAEARSVGGEGRAIFRRYLQQSALLGVAGMGLLLLGRSPAAAALNVPPAVVVVAAPMVLLALLRPVAAGMLQGRDQFVAFGLVRSAFAGGRLAVALLLIGGLGGAAVAGVASYPLAGTAAFLLALAALGRGVWRGGIPPVQGAVAAGWRLSLAALVAYSAYMLLLTGDVIWVNRGFPPASAASYATAAIFRRALSVLPGAILVVFYPRVIARVAAGRSVDRLLLRAGGAIFLFTAAAAALFFLIGEPLVALLFGGRYPDSGALLGWMGVGMVGYGIAALWLNLFLATRPWPFVLLLAGIALVQGALLDRMPGSLEGVTFLFGAAGTAAALGGLALYLIWLRPRLPGMGE